MNAISELTGLPVDTHSEVWRQECECRSVLALPSRDHRNAYMAQVKRIRGDAAESYLREGILQLYEARKRAKAA